MLLPISYGCGISFFRVMDVEYLTCLQGIPGSHIGLSTKIGPTLMDVEYHSLMLFGIITVSVFFWTLMNWC
jgi:hypothetical protein